MTSEIMMNEYRVYLSHLKSLGFVGERVSSKIDQVFPNCNVIHLGMFRVGTGITTYAEAIINGFQREGKRSIVLGFGVAYGLDKDVPFYSLDYLLDTNTIEDSWEQLYEVMRNAVQQSGATHLVCHREFPFGIIGSRLKSVDLDVTAVLYGHHTSMDLLNGPSGKQITEHLSQLDRVISISRFLKTETLRVEPKLEQKIPLARGGYDPTIFYPDRLKKAPSNGELQVGFVGRLNVDKDPITFVRSISYAVQNGMNIKASMFGMGSLQGELESLISDLSLSSTIILRGNLPSEEIANALRSLDLLIVPSQYEGLGVQTIEALASGVPVIASKVGGLIELIGESEAGVSLEPRNSSQFGQAIVDIGTDPSRWLQLRKRAIEFSDNQLFTWRHVLCTWEKCLFGEGRGCADAQDNSGETP